MKTFLIVNIFLVLSTFQLLFIQPHAYAETPTATQTVVSTGIGDSPQAAAQNAAENALTQVVGTFVNTETILKKRIEISDGIKEKSKEIATTTKEYSQGSIKSFEVLETTSDKGLYRISARVEVRIEDFKLFVKKLAEGSTKIDGLSLFPQGVTRVKNEANAKNKANAEGIVIKDILFPIYEGKATQFNVGTAKRWVDFSPSEKTKLHIYQNDRWNEHVIVVPVEIVINDTFLQNTRHVLDSIASNKKRVDLNHGEQFCRPSPGTIDGFLAIAGEKGSFADQYEFKGLGEKRVKGNNQLEEFLRTELLSINTTGDISSYSPGLHVTLLGDDNVVIEEFLIKNKLGSNPTAHGHRKIYTDDNWLSAAYANSICGLILIPHKTIHMYLDDMNPDDWEKVKTINIKMESK